MVETLVIPSAPLYVNIELTHWCNNRCEGCGNLFLDANRSQPPGVRAPLELGQWRNVLNEIRSSVNQVRFTGGEPTSHPEFEKILCHAAELDLPFAVFTNCRWGNPRQTVRLLKGFSKLKSILVSLHGSSSEAHDSFTGVKGSFHETISNIRIAVDAGLRVNSNTVITRRNYDKVQQIVELSRSLGVTTTVFARYVGGSDSDAQATPQQLKQAVRAAEDLAAGGEKVKISGCIPQCFVRSTATGCTAGYTSITIDPTGNVRPCNHAPVVCGNLLRESMDEIWQSKEMKSWRDITPKDCRDCSVLYLCHGGCHAQAMIQGGCSDPLMREPIADKQLRSRRRELSLCKNTAPLLDCLIREEPFGYLLVNGVANAPVSYQAKAILDECDGTASLEAIGERHGQKGLSLIVTLAKRGLMRFECQQHECSAEGLSNAP
jgi:radical SAM protein with 4Fe4S-binding SPASM domain